MLVTKKIFFITFATIIAFGVSVASLALAETQTGSVTVGVTISGTCGDGTVDAGEACDAGVGNGVCSATCSTSCTVNSCGGGGGTETPPATDNPPVISNVTTTGITVSAATVSWSASDDNSISSVSFVYGLTTSYGTTGSAVGTYSVNLSGLSAATTYYFKISVTDSGSNTVVSSSSFTTLPVVSEDTTPPVISNVQIVTNTTMATISFDTNEPTTAQIFYGLSVPYATSTALDSVLASSHNLPILGLWPNTTYHFQIVANDATNNDTTTADATFTTLLPNPPANVGNFTTTPALNTITLNWNSSAITYFSGVKITRQSISGTETLVDDNNYSAGEYIDRTISPNVDYTYTIYAIDLFGQYSTGVSATGRVNVTGLELCGDGIDNDSDSFVDCNDLDSCSTDPLCVVGMESDCSNNVDDNSDGLIDCLDPDCAGSGLCMAVVYGETSCNNLFDDDSDGAIDCADADCASHPSCAVAGGAEMSCADGSDNDGDGKTDFPDDPGCASASDDDESDSTVADFLRFSIDSANFFGGDRQIRLIPVGNRVTSLAASNFSILIPKANLDVAPESINLKINGLVYPFGFNPIDEIYYTDLTLPSVDEHDSYLVIDYGEGGKDELLIKLNSLASGLVMSGGEPISGAELKLLTASGADASVSDYWPSGLFLTSPSGMYGWVVANERYQILVKKDGYYEQTVQIYSVENNTINTNINLVKMPPKLADVIDPNASLGENALNVAKNLVEKTKATTERAAQAINEAANNPQVEQAATQVVAPTAVGISAVGTFAAIPWIDLVALLRFLFLQPLLLIGRGKRKQWGTVYNSLSKLSIDLALVRLIDANSGKLIRSRVTDSNGRYAFIVAPGKYRLEVVKSNLLFPSTLLATTQTDGNRPDIYHGEEINVTDDNVLVTANIPLDPVGETKTPKRILRERFWRKSQSVVSGLGLAFTLVALYISPVWYMWVLVAVHFGLIFLFRRLAKPKTGKGWGIVYDETTRKPIGRAVARLFDTRFNRLVATEITDKHGRYNFLAGDNKYYVAYEHNDYEPTKTDVIDLTGKTEDAIAADAKLKKKNL